MFKNCVRNFPDTDKRIEKKLKNGRRWNSVYVDARVLFDSERDSDNKFFVEISGRFELFNT